MEKSNVIQILLRRMKESLSILLVLALMLGQASAQIKVQQSSFQYPWFHHRCTCMHTHFILAADVSGSMSNRGLEDFVEGQTGWLTRFSDNLEGRDNIKLSIYKFNSDVVHIPPNYPSPNKFEHKTPCFYRHNPSLWSTSGSTNWTPPVIEATNIINAYPTDHTIFYMITDNSSWWWSVDATARYNFWNAILRTQKSGCRSFVRTFILRRSFTSNLSSFSQKVALQDEQSTKELTARMQRTGTEIDVQVTEVNSFQEAQRIIETDVRS